MGQATSTAGGPDHPASVNVTAHQHTAHTESGATSAGLPYSMTSSAIITSALVNSRRDTVADDTLDFSNARHQRYNRSISSDFPYSSSAYVASAAGQCSSATTQPLPTSPPSSFTTDTDAAASIQLTRQCSEGGCHGRIPGGNTTVQPVCEHGKKVSDTHYFVIPCRRRCTSTRHLDEICKCADRGDTKTAQILRALYYNVNVLDTIRSLKQRSVKKKRRKDASAGVAPVDGGALTSPTTSSSRPLAGGGGSVTQAEKLALVKEQVEGATDEEAQVALISKAGNVDKAVEYLKIEQLFRLGYLSRQKCARYLRQADWDMATAASTALRDVLTAER